MTVSRANFGDLLEPTMTEIFFEKYKEWPEEFSKVFNMETSKKQTETDSQVTGFSMFAVKTEGNPIAYDDPYQGYNTSYTHVTYAKGFRVTREMYEDDLYGIMKQMPKALARSARASMEQVAANILNNAFTVGTGGDGQFLCVTTHPLIGGGTEQNTLTAAADLTVTSLTEAIQTMEDTRDDRNLILNIKPVSLIVPKELKWTARELLDSKGRPYTANNEINPLQDEDLRYLVNHYLTDADAWFIQAAPDNHGLKFYTRRPIDFGRSNDFDTEDAKFKASYRVSVGWSDWRGIFGSPGV